jgi:hypothetical protein
LFAIDFDDGKADCQGMLTKNWQLETDDWFYLSPGTTDSIAAATNASERGGSRTAGKMPALPGSAFD